MKKAGIIILILAVLGLTWFLGPQLPEEPISHNWIEQVIKPDQVAAYVDQIESQVKLRPDNQARIVWYNDSLREETEYVVLYLHGFSASWYEGYPAHLRLAEKLKANLYLSRLASHGIDTPDPLIDMTPYRLYESAKEALAIAQALGRKVVVAGTSTGCTLALQLAADFPDRVAALILFSPNVAIYDAGATLLSGPWGLQIAKLVGGGGQLRKLDPGSEEEQKYWYKQYRWEGTVYLQQLLDETMRPSTFKSIKQPLFMAYYYKNEKEQDHVVKVGALLDMFRQVGTPEDKKQKIALPEAGRHEIACEATSKSVKGLNLAVNFFVDSILQPQEK